MHTIMEGKCVKEMFPRKICTKSWCVHFVPDHWIEINLQEIVIHAHLIINA